MVKMVIYDCDGVIFDSERANFEYYNYIFKYFNLSVINDKDEKSLEVLHTYSNDEVLKYFIKDKDLLEKALNFSKTIDYSMFYKFMKLEKDFFKTCEILKSNNIKIVVATNRSISFKGIVKYFKLDKILDDYVTALNVKNPKPAPDMLLLLLEKSKVKYSEAVFVGDSKLDLEAAKSANIRFVGYKFKLNFCDSIDNHTQLIDIIKKY